MVTILIMSVKITTPGLPKKKFSEVILKDFLTGVLRDYNVLISFHDVTKKLIVVDVIMWPKFGKSSISMREVTITSIL